MGTSDVHIPSMNHTTFILSSMSQILTGSPDQHFVPLSSQFVRYEECLKTSLKILVAYQSSSCWTDLNSVNFLGILYQGLFKKLFQHVDGVCMFAVLVQSWDAEQKYCNLMSQMSRWIAFSPN